MKKNVKFVVLVYVGVAIMIYAMSLRIDRLSSVEDNKNENKSIVLKLR